MTGRLDGRRIAILATDGFEEVELTAPQKALEGEGAAVDVVAPAAGAIQGYEHLDKSRSIAVDRALDAASAADYDGLVLPGGVINGDQLRLQPAAVTFIRDFVDSGKPIGAICHGLWSLIEAGGAEGRRLTSWPSLRTDLVNAGADWVDREVVRDDRLVTSRKPDDLPAFCREIVVVFGEAARPS